MKFDWSHRWLKGDEYAHILENREKYCQTFAMVTFDPKTHPESIYSSPESKHNTFVKFEVLDGMLYFVRGDTIGSDFGFPRLAYKKHYKW